MSGAWSTACTTAGRPGGQSFSTARRARGGWDLAAIYDWLGDPSPLAIADTACDRKRSGRKSAKAYRQPVSYVRDGDVLLNPGCRWTLNLAGGRPARIRLPGSSRSRAAPTGVSTPAFSAPRCGTGLFIVRWHIAEQG